MQHAQQLHHAWKQCVRKSVFLIQLNVWGVQFLWGCWVNWIIVVKNEMFNLYGWWFNLIIEHCSHLVPTFRTKLSTDSGNEWWHRCPWQKHYQEIMIGKKFVRKKHHDSTDEQGFLGLFRLDLITHRDMCVQEKIAYRQFQSPCFEYL